MSAFEVTFPKLLSELHEIEIEYDEDDGIDFEPYQVFQTAEENADWLQAWTGNKTLTGEEYRVFGQDGTGGYAAFWLTRKGVSVPEQPIVFFGSEGDVGVVANDLLDYLWLLAGGVGPMEAVERVNPKRPANADFTAFAEKHAKARKKTPREVIDIARKAFPTFEADIRALCK
jgi:hypothetical protein